VLIKAQAVCARTYAIANLNKHKSDGFDLCTTEDCQVYDGLNKATDVTNAAVDQTMGKYLTYNGELCVTFYSSSDGGATENSENVWVKAIPYLRGVIDPYEADIASIAPNYKWTDTYTPVELTARVLRPRNYNIGQSSAWLYRSTQKTGNVYKITLTDSNSVSRSFTKGDMIRSILGVKSIHFTISGGTSTDIYVNSSSGTISGGLQNSYAIGSSGLTEILGHNNVYAITGTGETGAVGTDPSAPAAPGLFVIKGTGRGHSVGMSQWGAYSMAKFHGMTYDQILQFYFTGAIVE
jgi:stage II sporulation protein D